MTFSEEVVRIAFRRAGGRCESCRTLLQGSRRGIQWHAHHKHSVSAGGISSLSNCKILCRSCHSRTYTMGRPNW